MFSTSPAVTAACRPACACGSGAPESLTELQYGSTYRLFLPHASRRRGRTRTACAPIGTAPGWSLSRPPLRRAPTTARPHRKPSGPRSIRLAPPRMRMARHPDPDGRRRDRARGADVVDRHVLWLIKLWLSRTTTAEDDEVIGVGDDVSPERNGVLPHGPSHRARPRLYRIRESRRTRRTRAIGATSGLPYPTADADPERVWGEVEANILLAQGLSAAERRPHAPRRGRRCSPIWPGLRPRPDRRGLRRRFGLGAPAWRRSAGDLFGRVRGHAHLWTAPRRRLGGDGSVAPGRAPGTKGVASDGRSGR